MAREHSTVLLAALACLCLVVAPVWSVSFNIVPDVRKCLREEVHKDVLVIGEYQLSDMPGLRTDIVV